jgi:hypothetical protein
VVTNLNQSNKTASGVYHYTLLCPSSHLEKEDLDVIDDYNSDSVDYSAYGSSSGELEGSDSSPSSEEDSSDDASGRNCNGGFHNSCYLARARSVYMCIWKS